MGVPGLFQGPMAKSHRMFLLTLTSLYLAIAPAQFQFHWTLPWCRCYAGPMALALIIIVIGGLLTALRRLLRIVRALRGGQAKP
jgi:hypothetical protein